MLNLIQEFWFSNRVTVSEELDNLAQYIKNLTNANLIEAKSGETCLTWTIPKKWKVNHGRLYTINGDIIADYSKNPLYLWSYSSSYKGKIARDKLIAEHIYTIPERPFEIPYHYVNSYKYKSEKWYKLGEWGFSLPYSEVVTMNDFEYYVDISTEFFDGSLKVIDLYLPGNYKDTIFLAAHTCHPAQVSDGIANVSIALEIYFGLQNKSNRKYSYRLIFGPEYFAAACFLAKSSPNSIKNLRYGIFLDMLSNNEPIAYQKTLQGNTLIDLAIKNTLRFCSSLLLEYEYRELWGNDEMFYSSQPFNIPVAGLGRIMHKEYHLSSDNFCNINQYHLLEAAWILKKIIEIMENNYIPVLNYAGPLYLSKYNLYVSPQENINLYKNLEKIQILADGKLSILEMSEKLECDFWELFNFFNVLEKENLCHKKEVL